jgi:hypothetical protein
MPDMLRAPERDRLIAFMERDLARGLTFGARRTMALRETGAGLQQHPWCWTADTAAAVELLSLPALRPRWAALADGMTEYLLAMGEPGQVLHRRAARAECKVDSIDPRDFRVLTGGYEFTGDLSRGLVRQEIRDMHGAREVLHTGHLVEFRMGRRKFSLDAEDAITSFGMVPRPDGVTLFHECLLTVPLGLLRRPGTAATLRYEYTIRAGDPRLRLRVSLQAAEGVALNAVRLTTALDELSGGQDARPIHRATLRADGIFRPLPLAGKPLADLHLGPAETLSLLEDAPPGLATGLHLGLVSGPQLLNIKLTSRETHPGGGAVPHWLLLRYQQAQLTGGDTFAIEEERLVTCGTLAGHEPTYASLLRDPAPLMQAANTKQDGDVAQGRDPGASADYGVALNAVATQIFFASTGAYDGNGAHEAAAALPEARLASLRDWYDRHLLAFFAAMADGEAGAALRPTRIGLRPLAFALLSLDLMLRLPHPANSPDYAGLLATGLEALLARQQPGPDGGAFVEADGGTYLDCHAAALLALGRLALRQPEERLAVALRQGLLALRIGPVETGLDGQQQDAPILGARRPDGSMAQDNGFWSFKLGLLMRALNVLTLASQTGAATLRTSEAAHLQTLFDTCFHLLRGRVRAVENNLEVLTSPSAREGNAATQPIVILAMVSADEAVLAMAGSRSEPVG